MDVLAPAMDRIIEWGGHPAPVFWDNGATWSYSMYGYSATAAGHEDCILHTARRGGLVEAGGSAVWSGAGRTAAQTLLCTICEHMSAIALSLAQLRCHAPPTPATLRSRSSGLCTGDRAHASFHHRLHAGFPDLTQIGQFRR